MNNSGGARGGRRRAVTTENHARRRASRVNGAAQGWLAARDDVAWEERLNRVVLPLASLAPDAGGEIVLTSQAGLNAITIATSEAVVRSGIVPYRRLTASGIDVSGYRFLGFESGLTLYYPQRVTLTVTAQPA